jgi:uncharacterized protein DUF1360
MPSVITVVVFALAVARVTRLVTGDKLTEGPRGRLVDRAWRRWRPAVPVEDRARADEPKPAYLLTCPWCASIYVAAAAAPLCWFWGATPWLFIPALLLAFSQVTGLLAMIGD